MRFWGTLVSLLLPFSAACGSSEPGGSEDDLVGGKIASDSAFPSVFRFTNQARTCTGVKVGPRHILTAAHCVTAVSSGAKQSSIPVADPKFGPGQLLTLARHSYSTDAHEHIVRDTYIHPSHLTGGADAVGDVDLAVIVTQELLEEFVAATVDRDAVSPSQSLTILGYGCAKGDSSTSSSLRYGESTVVKAESAIASLKLSASAADSAFYTEGQGRNPSAPSICNGDSGGAVFRTGTTRVVGVNGKGYGSPATLNAHARLDGKTKLGVAAWLTNLGVSVSPKCTKDTCASAPAVAK